MEVKKNIQEGNPILTQTPAINPYRHAFGLMKRRFRWDLNLEALVSRRKMRKIQNSHIGEKCVILCNGPSLLHVDFEELKQSNVYTFGLNKINLLFDKTEFRPSCVVSVNKEVIEQNSAFFNSTEIPLFINCHKKDIIKRREDVIFFHPVNIRGFSRDCSMSLFTGFTVTYVAMQLAFHLGFFEVALVGCDHNFATKGPANATVASGESDPNHFDPKYFSGGVNWQLPDISGSEYAYTMANSVFEGFGRKIYNCTVGGKLEVFERKCLSDFLS